MNKLVAGLIALLTLGTGSAFAEVLPPLDNIRIEDNQLKWDASEDATGYNIYYEYSYYDTVKGAEQYTLTDSGRYFVVPFDDQGNFGAQYGNFVEYVADGNGQSQYTVNSFVILVQKTCLNVGPGESCVASCPNSYETEYTTRFTKYMSGGACSTSDIVEADAFVSVNTYKCTVPTFSGEVVAQAICVTY